MEFRAILGALRSGWWLLALSLVIGVGGALIITLVSTPQYTSQSELFVSATNLSSPAEVYQGSQFSEQRVDSYARLLTGEELAARVITSLKLPTTPQELTNQVTATAVPNTVLLDYSVSDPSPQRAQQITTELGQQFIALVKQLETPDTGTGSPVQVTVVKPADLPTSASSPRVVQDLLIGGFLGLVIGVGLALGRSRIDRTVRETQVGARVEGSAAIGVIPSDTALLTHHVFERESTSPSAEGYRQLRMNLQFLNVDRPPQVIVVSSALASEGKTTLVVNLALALAEAGRQVTIVDGDLRRPRVSRYLGMVGGAGLTSILAGTADLDDVIQPYGDGSLSVLGSGPTPPNPSELLSSEQMGTLLDELRAKNDFVLIDAPPVLPVADTSALAVVADGVLLSVRYGKTRKDLVQQSLHILNGVGAKVFGIVLNFVPQKAAAVGYGYSYGEDHKR